MQTLVLLGCIPHISTFWIDPEGMGSALLVLIDFVEMTFIPHNFVSLGSFLGIDPWIQNHWHEL